MTSYSAHICILDLYIRACPTRVNHEHNRGQQGDGNHGNGTCAKHQHASNFTCHFTLKFSKLLTYFWKKVVFKMNTGVLLPLVKKVH